jgi:hypothetical protein
MKFKTGKKYRVLKEGTKLSWEESIGPSAWQGKSLDLSIGDELEYIGCPPGWGSDPIPVENFQKGTVRGEFWPNTWGTVEDGYLEEME